MTSTEFILAAETGATVADLQDEVAIIWAELRTPGTAAYTALKAVLADEGIQESPETFLSPSASDDLSVRQAEENFDPTVGLLVVAAWLGKKLADKAFDEFWKRVVVPRLDKRWGQGAIQPKA